MTSMAKLEPSFLRYFIYNNACISAMDTLATGTLLTAYALALGASPLVVGILGGLPYFGTLLNAVGAYLVYRGFNVKKVTVGFAFASRPCYLFCGAIACFPELPHAALWLCGGIGLCYLMGGVSSGGYYPWLKALLPEKQTYLFVAKKYFFSKIAYVFGFLGAFLIIKKYTSQRSDIPVDIYAFLFLFAFFLGMLGTIFLLGIPTPPVSSKPVLPPWKAIKYILKKYILLMLVCGLSLFVFFFFSTFVPVFALQEAKISVAALTALSLLSQLFFLISVSVWKHMNERFHASASLRAAFLFLAAILGIFILCTMRWHPGMAMYVAAGLLLAMAVAQAGILTGVDSLLLLNSPQKYSTAFFTVASWMRLAAAIGPMLAGLVWMTLQRWGTEASSLVNWQLFFGICFIGSIVCWYVCKRTVASKYM